MSARLRARRAIARCCCRSSPDSDPDDATTSARPVPDYLGALGAEGLSGLTVGVADHGVALEPEIAAAMDESIRTLERIGAKVVRIALPDLAPRFRVGETIIKGEAAAMHRQWLRDAAAGLFQQRALPHRRRAFPSGGRLHRRATPARRS